MRDLSLARYDLALSCVERPAICCDFRSARVATVWLCRRQRRGNASTDHAVTLKCAKSEEGRLITGPRLLISGSKPSSLGSPSQFPS
jgi:hypothetical protein